MQCGNGRRVGVLGHFEGNQMKKFLMGSVALLALAAPAAAADLGPRTYTKAPVYAPAPVYNWTGFYLGAHIGGAWNADNSLAGFTNSDSGRFIGGGQIGADYQFAPNWLIGIEANVSALAGNDQSWTNGAVIATRGNDYLGSVTGRLGYVFGPAVLYVKGGLGFTDTTYGLTTAGGAAIPFVNSSDKDLGYTVGGGLEYLFAPNWSAKAEYQYFNFDHGQQFISAAFPAGVAFDHDFHTFKVGVNYRFGGASAPVVAKY